MTAPKNINKMSDDYNELKKELVSNCQKLVESSIDLNNIVLSVFKDINDPSEPYELDSIKEEWVKSYNKIDSIKDKIIKLQEEKTNIIKKIDSIIKKKGKSSTSDSKNLNIYQDEWLEISTQISVLNTQLETFNKDRAKIIKKADTYFSKLETSKIKTSVKKAGSKNTSTQAKKPTTKKNKKDEEEEKVVTKKPKDNVDGDEEEEKVVAKKPKGKVKKYEEEEQVVTKKPKGKVKEEIVLQNKQDSKKLKKNKLEEKEVETNQNNLKLESDSDSDTSESDTDSDLSSMESESDSDSDKDDDKNE